MKLFITTFALCFLLGPAYSETEVPSLQEALEEKKEKGRANADPKKLEIYQVGVDEVAASGIMEKAKKKGDTAPDFTLKKPNGEEITLSEELKKGPVVLTWYRGGWCPYCNIQLAAYQQILPQIEELGAQLIAISPEVPDKSLTTVEKNELKFPVLTDLNLKVAKEYDIVFKLHPEVGKIYSGFFDMKEYNGDEATDELPLAATYVINQEGKIVYSFLEAEYTLRAEPREVIEVLDSLD